MAEETKITFKMGLIASGVAALIVMVMGCLWNYHGRLTVLETNYSHVASTLTKIDTTVEAIRDDQIRLKQIEKGRVK